MKSDKSQGWVALATLAAASALLSLSACTANSEGSGSGGTTSGGTSGGTTGGTTGGFAVDCGSSQVFQPFTQPAFGADGTVDGLCLGCSLDVPSKAVDQDPGNYVRAVIPVGLLNGKVNLTIDQIDAANPIIIPPGTRPGFVVEDPHQLLVLSLFGNASVTTVNSSGSGSVDVETAKTDSTAAIKLDLLGLLSNPDQRFVAFQTPTTQPYTGIRLSYGGVADVLNQLDIYAGGACMDSGNGGLTGGTSGGTSGGDTGGSTGGTTGGSSGGTTGGTSGSVFPDACPAGYSFDRLRQADNVSASGMVTGLCLGCKVSDATFAIDDDANSFAELYDFVGLLNPHTSLQLLSANQTYPAGSQVAFVVRDPLQLLTVDVINAVTLSTIDSNKTVLESARGSLQIVEADLAGLLGNPDAQFLTFPTTRAFNGVKLDLYGLAEVNNKLDVYYAGVCVKN
jgi:hypothetical protein